MTESLRVVYAGTPDFAVPALEALAAAGHEIPAVYTQPDRPAGRGRRPRPSPVKARAQALGVPVRQPEGLKDRDLQDALRALAPDVMVVAAYGLILPRAVLEIPRHGCLNIHASLLPRWRGAAPIQRAILAGDPETGVCLMKMAEGLDTGPVIDCVRTPIGPEDTGGSVHDRLAELGAQLMGAPLSGYVDGSLTPRPQPEDGVTYAAKLTKAEARIDWGRGAAELERLIRAFDPWPVAHTEWQGQPLRIWRAAVVGGDRPARPGTVVRAAADGVDVATGEGVLRLLELQAPGRRRQPVHEFLNGNRLARGHRFA